MSYKSNYVVNDRAGLNNFLCRTNLFFIWVKIACKFQESLVDFANYEYISILTRIWPQGYLNQVFYQLKTLTNLNTYWNLNMARITFQGKLKGTSCIT